MVTLSIPQGLIKEGFVVLPRREYEDLLYAKQGNGTVVKRSSSFKVPKKHEKFYDELDKELTQTLQEVEEGKVSATFDTAEEAIKFSS
jgi:DNA-binding GntR family transcriptional regulator